MARQWLRRVNLQVGSGGSVIDLSTLRIRFEVYQTTIQTPGYANIIITNPSKATASRIRQEYKSVVLQAGYDENIATIFQGEIVQVRYGRETPTDTYLYIIAKANQQAYSYAFVNKTLSAGHTLRDQVDECLKVLQPFGVTAGYIADLGSTKMIRGKSLFGMVRNQLRAICMASGTSWSFQDNKLQIVRNDSYVPGKAIVLNSRTGLVGMPAQTLGGIEVRCLLNPEIKPGRRIHINQGSIQEAAMTVSIPQSAQNSLIPETAADGLYKVIAVTHSGDTRGNPYYSDIICLSASGSIIPAALSQTYPSVDPQDN